MTVLSPKLSGKQRVFADEYVGEARFNATQAAATAGYKSPRISGQENLKNPIIREYIADALRHSALTRDEVLSLVAEDARRSDQDVLDQVDGISSEIVRSSAVSALISARTAARTNLMKAHGLFTENINVSGSLRREIVLVDPSDE